MTLRERIADWISGGALSRKERVLATSQKWQSRWVKLAFNEARLHQEANARLDRIAAQETPNANATVRRMARIARGEE